MVGKRFKFKTKIWRYPGYGGWFFVTVPKNISAVIKRISKPYGAGFVRTKATVGKTTWETALFPHKESQAYLLSIKKNVRSKEGLFEDSDIAVIVSI